MTTLSYTQRAELILLAAEAGRMFVAECAAVLNPNDTDWPATAWNDARYTLPWIKALISTQYAEAWDLYQQTLIAETHRLMAWPWRTFIGAETAQIDGVTGHPAHEERWYVEPKDYTGDTLYSPDFATRAEAEAWADSQEGAHDES